MGYKWTAPGDGMMVGFRAPRVWPALEVELFVERGHWEEEIGVLMEGSA